MVLQMVKFSRHGSMELVIMSQDVLKNVFRSLDILGLQLK